MYIFFIYYKPIPVDTINKFWGIDSKQLKHDEIVQKQSFEQSYKNFWSFVEFNAEYFINSTNMKQTFSNQ